MLSDSRAVSLVAAYCDIEERLTLVPPSAHGRGAYFNSIMKQLDARGLLPAYREYFPADRFGSLTFYPIRDYLIRLACAGALFASPQNVHEGMFALSKSNARTFMDTVLGRILLRVLSRDPVRLTEQGIAGRRQSTNYGHWELVRQGERAFEVIYREEYIWIESAIAGAGAGTYEACGVDITVEHRLIDRFNGSSFYRW